MRGCLMRGCLMRGCLMRGCLMRGCPMRGCPMRGCPMRGCPMRGCLMRGCPMRGCLMRGCLMRGCLMRGYLMRGCLMRGCLMRGCLMRPRQDVVFMEERAVASRGDRAPCDSPSGRTCIERLYAHHEPPITNRLRFRASRNPATSCPSPLSPLRRAGGGCRCGRSDGRCRNSPAAARRTSC